MVPLTHGEMLAATVREAIGRRSAGRYLTARVGSQLAGREALVDLD